VHDQGADVIPYGCTDVDAYDLTHHEFANHVPNGFAIHELPNHVAHCATHVVAFGSTISNPNIPTHSIPNGKSYHNAQ